MDKEDIMKNLEVRYLERLAELYPTIAAASTEVINLERRLSTCRKERSIF